MGKNKHVVVLIFSLLICFCVVGISSCGCVTGTNEKTEKNIIESSKINNDNKMESTKKTSDNKDSESTLVSSGSKSKSISSKKNTSTSQFTVVFFTEDGKELSKQKVYKNGSANEPKPPKKKGYYFYSWSRSINKVTGDLEVTSVYLKEGTVPQIELETVTVDPNQKNVELTVAVKNNPGIASLAFDLVYDKKHLKLTDFKYNTDALKGASTVPFNPDADPTCLSMVNGTENVTGDFTFATLYFDILDGAKGSYPITAVCDDENIYNIDEENIKFELVNGLITVK